MNCRDCALRQCRHRRRWVGPFLICRCLACPVLVVGVAR